MSFYIINVLRIASSISLCFFATFIVPVFLLCLKYCNVSALYVLYRTIYYTIVDVILDKKKYGN